MACSHFIDGHLCRCGAVRGLVVPSHHERERYCRSEDHARCPTFRARAQRTDALPEEVYYALWLPSLGGGASEDAAPTFYESMAGDAPV
jgi:hypothetical protein